MFKISYFVIRGSIFQYILFEVSSRNFLCTLALFYWNLNFKLLQASSIYSAILLFVFLTPCYIIRVWPVLNMFHRPIQFFV